MVPPVVIPAQGEHTKTLIFFHGLGDTGHGWASSMAEARLPYFKVIAPTANTIPVTLNGGFSMPSWFDIMALSEAGPEDTEGIHKAAEEAKKMIDAEIASTGISSENIVLGGFSQGGALALYTALTCEKKLGGVIALSTWLPLRHEFPDKLCSINKSIKIFQGHGTIDPIVPLRWGDATYQYLRSIGVTNYTFKKYSNLMHSSCADELGDVQDFLGTL